MRAKQFGTHHGLVEWQVVVLGRRGGIEKRHSEGAQTIFGLMRAKEIVKALGAPWEVRHVSDVNRPPGEED